MIGCKLSASQLQECIQDLKLARMDISHQQYKLAELISVRTISTANTQFQHSLVYLNLMGLYGITDAELLATHKLNNLLHLLLGIHILQG